MVLKSYLYVRATENLIEGRKERRKSKNNSRVGKGNYVRKNPAVNVIIDHDGVIFEEDIYPIMRAEMPADHRVTEKVAKEICSILKKKGHFTDLRKTVKNTVRKYYK